MKTKFIFVSFFYSNKLFFCCLFFIFILADNNNPKGFSAVCLESCRFSIYFQSNGYLPEIDTSNIIIRARKYKDLKHLTHLESLLLIKNNLIHNDMFKNNLNEIM